MTAHGLDEGDRQALLSAYGHKVNEKMVRNCPPGTLVFNDVEHMNVRPYHKIGKIRSKNENVTYRAVRQVIGRDCSQKF